MRLSGRVATNILEQATASGAAAPPRGPALADLDACLAVIATGSG